MPMFEIRIFKRGELFGHRAWPVIPSSGDIIIVGRDDKQHELKIKRRRFNNPKYPQTPSIDLFCDVVSSSEKYRSGQIDATQPVSADEA